MSLKEETIGLLDRLSDGDLHVVNRMLRGLVAPESASAPANEAERLARIDAVCGKYAFTHTSVDEFLARKREDIEREEERYRQRHPEER